MTELLGRTTAGRVHVLRQAFRPSQPLKELIEEYAGPSVGPDFLLHSTKQVLVDSVEYSRGEYREQDKLVREALREEARRPLVMANATLRIVGVKQPIAGGEASVIPKKLRVNLFPVVAKRLDRLASLLDIYPAVGPVVRPPHHLYVDLPLTGPPNRDELESKESQLKSIIEERIDTRLFAASALHVMASERPRTLRVTPHSEAAS